MRLSKVILFTSRSETNRQSVGFYSFM